MTGVVAGSVDSLQRLVVTIANVDAASSSIGHAIVEQESLAARVSSSLESMRGAVFTLSREIREAAQIVIRPAILTPAPRLLSGCVFDQRVLVGCFCGPNNAGPRGSVRQYHDRFGLHPVWRNEVLLPSRPLFV